MPTDWTRRDLPLLVLAYEAQRSGQGMLRTTTSAETLGLEVGDLWAGLQTLKDAGYLTWLQMLSHGRYDFTVSGLRLLERGLVELDQWPLAGVDALIEVIDEHLANETDPDKRSKLVRLRDALLGVGKDVGTSILTDVIKKATGLDGPPAP